MNAAMTALIITVIVLMSLISSEEHAEIQHQQSQACRMMALWYESDGEYGWPPEYAEGFCDESAKIGRNHDRD